MKSAFIKTLQQQLSDALHKEVAITESRQVYGGDINTTYILIAGNERYFMKCNGAAALLMFQKECNGLHLLKQKSQLRVPAPFVYGQFENITYLVMECLEKTAFTPEAWRALGEGLADMHQQTQAKFGWEEDNYIGSLPQPNRLSDTWAEFYAAQRLLPLMRRAFDNRLCTEEDLKTAKAVCNKLAGIFPVEPPALLHGDLWSGNAMACDGEEAAVYDPAVYYGHREMDIAMTLLFGGFDSSFYYHYNAIYPLQSDWQQRVALCQLYPLLVHLNLFGSGYYGRVKSVLNQYK